MKTLVTYFTETGNTEKLARAIYEAISGAKEIMPVRDVESVDDYDLVFCGFPVQSHSIPVPVQNFLKELPPGENLALFATHGSLRGGELAKTAFEYAMSLASKAKVLGTFGCRGKVEPKLIETLMKQPEHRAWAQMAQSAASHPNAADLADGKAFARNMMDKASRT